MLLQKKKNNKSLKLVSVSIIFYNSLKESEYPLNVLCFNN